MLGFDAMEKYFNEPQNKLTADLEDRGFTINKSAMLESGHSTRIAIPELMCPDYCDKYLAHILDNHKTAMQYREKKNTDLFNASYYNETINAFNSKGYTTISMALDDVFFSAVDISYYVAAHYTSESDYANLPYYINNYKRKDATYMEKRLSAQHLGDIFLGGLPDVIFDKLNKGSINKHRLSAETEKGLSILPDNNYANKYSALIESFSDSLNSVGIKEPKFILAHALMAHYPIWFDENGNLVAKQGDIMSYPGQHAFATKVITKIIDMILEVDPDAVIVLQADHGLHGQTEEQIAAAFGSPDAAIDIWNNVFSAVRIPDKYKNGDEIYAERNPLNMSRYLVNSFVGKNYAYVEGQ